MPDLTDSLIKYTANNLEGKEAGGKDGRVARDSAEEGRAEEGGGRRRKGRIGRKEGTRLRSLMWKCGRLSLRVQ
ncbi:hypothetical protein L596_029380 [Steinernema carpocapsae]|uniref:Uncharacterized protein n=1 Tax=Steinernema carpocapsae TaxID=34508 RepID=A0A4U5LUG6_STECR|nr:hypothetical protein L596_029380 [Steinernema carpocapsae]